MASLPKPSILQRVRLAAARLLAPKAYTGSFESAKYSIHRTRVDAVMPADFRLELSEAARVELVRLSRWMANNNGFYRQMVRDTSTYAVGDGFALQALGGDSDWQSLIEAEWEAEMKNAEVTGRYSLLESLTLMCEAIDVDGEIFVIKTIKGGIPKFQLVESHRIQTPPELVGRTNITEGIQFNEYGQPTFYYVSGRDNKGFSRIPAVSMMHIYEPVRSTAVRAYPPHQHALNNLRDEMDLLAMEKLAAKDNSRVSRILRTNDSAPDFGDVGLGEPTNRNPSTDPNNISRTLGGVTAVLQSNEELVAHEYARPSSAFTGFIDHLRRDSCMGASLPYEVLVNPSAVGGAAARYIVSKTNRYVGRRQSLIISRFLVPWFEFWLGVKINRGDLPAARNWWKCEFQTSKPITVDAGRESANDRADLMMGTLTPQEYFQMQGKNYEKAMLQKARNLQFRQKVASAFNAQPDELLNLKSPADIQAAASERQAQINAASQAAAAGIELPTEEDDGITTKEVEMLDPELSPPELAPPAKEVPIQSLVDTLPLQNEGLSRNPENPNYNP